METTIVILAILAGLFGIVGSIVPGLPGPPVSWIGLLLLYFWGPGLNASGNPMPLSGLIIWGVAMVVVTVLDYIVPLYFTKVTGGSKYAGRGATVGLIVGLLFTPLVGPFGMIIGAFLGAFIAELSWGKKTKGEAMKSAAGSFIGFFVGTGLKIIVSVLIFWRIIVYAF